ncbi:PriCT-2 domain-containing protein [Pandoraea fibrosis]
MALHSFLPGEHGKTLWDEWAQKVRDQYDQPSQDRMWRNFKSSGGVTKGTLFYHANLFSQGSALADVPFTESARSRTCTLRPIEGESHLTTIPVTGGCSKASGRNPSIWHFAVARTWLDA